MAALLFVFLCCRDGVLCLDWWNHLVSRLQPWDSQRGVVTGVCSCCVFLVMDARVWGLVGGLVEGGPERYNWNVKLLF